MTKGALRHEARRLLAALSPEERSRASEGIAERVWALPEVAGAGTLLLFAGRTDEVATDAVAAEALRRGVRLVYPRADVVSGRMSLHPVGTLDSLVPGAFGIREPDPHAGGVVPAGAVDVALVPGLAWDRAGGRLGRGGGFFDRLFAEPEWRGFRCGLFFAGQEVPRVPRDPWDATLHAVVTEREICRADSAAVPPP